MKQTRLHPRLSGMTSGTLNRSPGDRIVVTPSAEFSLSDFCHVDVVRTGPHLKDGWMANLTFELHLMIPVGETTGGMSAFSDLLLSTKSP